LAGPALAGGTIAGRVEHESVRWIRDTVVYIERVNGDFEPEPATMDQKNYRFVPKFLQVIVGSTVTFTNSDATVHNVHSPDGAGYDLGAKGKGGVLEHTFDEVGVYTQLCRLHPTMVAYVIVLQNPFYAVSNKQGEFKIENVPPGHHRLVIWNERYKADPIEVDVTDGAVSEVTVELHR
jgi:plastocyanin